MEEHYYNAANTKLRDLGLEPHSWARSSCSRCCKTIERYKDRVIERAILPRTRWKPGELEAALADARRPPPSASIQLVRRVQPRPP